GGGGWGVWGGGVRVIYSRGEGGGADVEGCRLRRDCRYGRARGRLGMAVTDGDAAAAEASPRSPRPGGCAARGRLRCLDGCRAVGTPRGACRRFRERPARTEGQGRLASVDGLGPRLPEDPPATDRRAHGRGAVGDAARVVAGLPAGDRDRQGRGSRRLPDLS